MQSLAFIFPSTFFYNLSIKNDKNSLKTKNFCLKLLKNLLKIKISKDKKGVRAKVCFQVCF